MRHIVPFFLLLTVALVSAPAHADIAPPRGFVEQCTVERHATAGVPCEICVDAYHGDRDACVTQYADREGWERKCRTRGASTWDEVWCGPAGDPSGVPTIAAPTTQPTEAAEPPDDEQEVVVDDEANDDEATDEEAAPATDDEATDEEAAPAAEEEGGCASAGSPAQTAPFFMLLAAMMVGRRRR